MHKTIDYFAKNTISSHIINHESMEKIIGYFLSEANECAGRVLRKKTRQFIKGKIQSIIRNKDK